MSLESHFEKPDESPILSKYPKFLPARRPPVPRRLGEGDDRRRHLAARPRSADGRGSRGPSRRSAEAGAPLNEGRRRAAGPRHRRGRARRRDHDGHIDGPPAEIGHKVGAALVGTFLGILLSYGFVAAAGDAASSIASRTKGDYEQCIKAGLLAIYKGLPPAIAVEFARRVLPHDVRPTFEETEQLCRGARGRRRRRRRRPERSWPNQPVIVIKKKQPRRTTATTAAPGRWRTPTS